MIGISYFKRNRKLAELVSESLPKHVELIDLDEYSGEECNTIISVGGDGTFAKTVSTIKFDKIMGINPANSVGAHCSFNIDEWDKYIDKFLNDNYKIIKRSKLLCELNNKTVDCAVNEVLITALKWGRTLKYELTINNDKEVPTSGSALFIYARMGYTGFLEKLLNPYNKKTIDASVEKVGIASIASNYGFNSWRELDNDLLIKVKITNKWGGAYLAIDGAKTEIELKEGDEIRVTSDEYNVIIF